MQISLFLLLILIAYNDAYHNPINSLSKTILFGAKPNVVAEVRNFDGLQEGMKYRYLPNTDTLVSEICLGTMLFGEQVSKVDAFNQMDLAKSYGINFLDTAESYPVPSAPSTTGSTECIIGEYMKKNGNSRNDFIISTKVSGWSDQMDWIRKNGETTRVSKNQLEEAVDAQLSRLGTDHIDLLQIHWPDRYVPLWGAPGYDYTLERENSISIEEQLEGLNSLIKSGKIKHYGLSNETPYGLSSFCHIADAMNIPRPVVTQNCYNLLVRNDFETGLLEACSPNNCNVGLLAYSPLAGGSLTGKYLDLTTCSKEARMRKFVGYMHRYISPPSIAAVEAYMEISQEFDIPLEVIALAFVYSREFVTSTIIGASSTEQLKSNIMALNLPIREDLEIAINKVYQSHMDPSKGVFDVVDPNMEYMDPSKLPWGARDVDVDPELDVLINQRLSKM